MKNPSSQYNHLDKLLKTHIITTIKTSRYNITIRKVRAHSNILGNEEAYKLAQNIAEKSPIMFTLFHLIGQ